jgi:hypothetical protein
MTTPDTKAIRAKAKMWHLPAGIADDILALCDAYEYSRLAVAHANDHADTAISDMQELRAENERLRAALKPFVLYVHDDYRRGEGRYVLASVAVIGGKGDGWLEAEDFRRARDALAQKGGE